MTFKVTYILLTSTLLSLTSKCQNVTPATLKIKNLISAFSCSNDSCFKDFMKKSGYIQSNSEKIENGITYYYEEPSTLYVDNGLKDEFASVTSLKDGYIYILGLTTKSFLHRNSCIKELGQLGFKITDAKNQSAKSPDGISYKSTMYPNYILTYFESLPEKNNLIYTFNIVKIPK